MRSEAIESLTGARMPTTRDEDFRFTDLSRIVEADIQPPAGSPLPMEEVEHLVFSEGSASFLVLLDGSVQMDKSNLTGLPPGVYVGPASGAPEWALESLGRQSAARGNVLAALNTSMASDVVVVAVSSDVHVAPPIHVLMASTSAEGSEQMYGSAPRILVCLQSGSSAEIIEDCVTLGEGRAFTNSVMEVYLSEGSSLKHGYLQASEPCSGAHTKATLVEQEACSSYSLVETRLGCLLTRHDLRIQQNGPDTSTKMRHFILCGADQLHDLHSKLTLDHPRGVADQLHKCISTTASSRGVFDGNVKVNRSAQQTDAGQLSRNLLLAPRATVNVKPNLQIIADDVTCTHGCAVSDLSDEELFYFVSRGIDRDTARECLVFSFGAEVIKEHGYSALTERLQTQMKMMLK